MSKLDLFKQTFYLDETSPSNLRWNLSPNNRCKKGSVAGCRNSHGYWTVQYAGKVYPVSKIVLSLYSNKYYEDLTADHIDRCPSNNKPSNLRWQDKSGQNRNRRSWGFKTMDNSLNTFEKLK